MGRTRDSEFDALALVRARRAAAGGGLYLGTTHNGPLFAPPEHCVLVLGPPRSGKTSGLVVPNIISAPGAVLATSTKRDLLDETVAARSRVGACMLFDPSGTVAAPPGVERVGWSPLASSATFDGARLVSQAIVSAARPGGDRGDAAHWNERAAALLSCLFHAAALGEVTTAELSSLLNRREPAEAMTQLVRAGADVAVDVLTGLLATDAREQSGIWSTAAGVLGAYQSPGALRSADLSPISPEALLEEAATLYVVAPAEHQRLGAPLVAGLLADVRRAAYRRAGAASRRDRPGPVLELVLDELANIAPLEDLAQLVSEGGSQGVVTLGCLQDMSQARRRWPAEADGFFSLFGAKVILPGIGDTRTLEAVSLLAGEHDVPVHSRTSQRRGLRDRAPLSTTVSSRRVRRLPPDAVAAGEPGRALVVLGTAPRSVAVTPAHSASPWLEAVGGGRVEGAEAWLHDAPRGRDQMGQAPRGRQRERPEGPGRSR